MAAGAENTMMAQNFSTGHGVMIRRGLPIPGLRRIGPFILLDEFFVSPDSSFPQHQHAGFEIVTYMAHGALKHSDSMGNHGTLNPGDVMRILAGTGITHSEYPGTEGMNHGIQLWIEVPKEARDSEPGYQVLHPEDLVVEQVDGCNIRHIAEPGSPLNLHSDVIYLDITMEQDSTFSWQMPEGWEGFVYLLQGHLSEPVAFPPSIMRLQKDNHFKSDHATRLLLIAGEFANPEAFE